MAYDPQRDRPRRQSSVNGASAVDSLLDGRTEERQPSAQEPTPEPSSGVASGPPEAWSERLLYSVGISTVLGALVGLVVLRWLWRIWRRRTR